MTLSDEYEDKRQYGRKDYEPEVRCVACGEWLLKEDAVKVDDEWYHDDCIEG